MQGSRAVGSILARPHQKNLPNQSVGIFQHAFSTRQPEPCAMARLLLVQQYDKEEAMSDATAARLLSSASLLFQNKTNRIASFLKPEIFLYVSRTKAG